MSGDLFSASESEIKNIVDYRERCKIEWNNFRKICPCYEVTTLGVLQCQATFRACPTYEKMMRCPLMHLKFSRVPPLPGTKED